MAIKGLFLNSGVTYCSRESTTRQQVIPQFDSRQFEMFKKRFKEEARTLHNLRNIQGVVKVLQVFEENGTVYMPMEYLQGEKWKNILKEKAGYRK